MKTVLVTGAAGFIGSAISRYLLDRGDRVIGLDNMNAYYDVELKKARLALIKDHANFSFIKGDLEDTDLINKTFAEQKPDGVVNMAAQAGVRHSLENPHSYVDSNLKGFMNILEASRHSKLGHLVYASSSSVYGANETLPFSEHDNVDHPVSLYAATKKANELMAHCYSHLFGIPTTGLRFFTVYGPWGRPDMALFRFTKNILAGEPIDLYNNGKHSRDFTYVDDIVEGVVRILDKPAEPDPDWSGKKPDSASSSAPYRVYNIGNSSPVSLMDFVACLEKELGTEAKKNYLPMQPGDVEATWADTSDLSDAVNYKPGTDVATGISRFVAWYRDYYKIA